MVSNNACCYKNFFWGRIATGVRGDVPPDGAFSRCFSLHAALGWGTSSHGHPQVDFNIDGHKQHSLRPSHIRTETNPWETGMNTRERLLLRGRPQPTVKQEVLHSLMKTSTLSGHIEGQWLKLGARGAEGKEGQWSITNWKIQNWRCSRFKTFKHRYDVRNGTFHTWPAVMSQGQNTGTLINPVKARLSDSLSVYKYKETYVLTEVLFSSHLFTYCIRKYFKVQTFQDPKHSGPRYFR